MEEPFYYNPPQALWFDCDVYVKFFCNSPPEHVHTEVGGMEHFGFIISHQYIIRPSIGLTHKRQCDKEGCENAICYEFEILFSLYDKVGIGFNFGGGTGTFGWKFRPKRSKVKYLTSCICCDTERVNDLRMQQANKFYAIPPFSQQESGVGAIATFIILSGGSAYSLLNISNLLSQVFLISCGALISISIVSTIARMIKLRSRITNLDTHNV